MTTIKPKIIIFACALVCVFFVGYALRLYLDIISPLPFSPYDILLEKNNSIFFGDWKEADIFTEKTFSYPLPYFLKKCLGALNNIFLIYIVGAAIVYYLAKEITNSRLGGFLAFAVFAVSSENLLHYTTNISAAGLNYVLIWTALLFLYRYFQQKKDIELLLFVLASMLAVLSYHTGAVALASIALGYFLVFLFSNKTFENKFLLALVLMIGFVFYWLVAFDLYELYLISNTITSTNAIHMVGVVCFVTVIFIAVKYMQKWQWLSSPIIPAVAILISFVLVFIPYNIFGFLLVLGPDNYYASAVTLNNYVAQILITHVYFFSVLPLISKLDEKKKMFFFGWMVGLGIVAAGLFLEHYYARILDYTFPLMFVLFGYYWTQQKKLRTAIVPATILILIISQIFVFNDPFTLRRYYTQQEIDSAKKIIEADIGTKKDAVASDLRTVALFHYLGDDDIFWIDKEAFNLAFYGYETIPEKIDRYPEENVYIILSDTMRYILYATNFEKKVLDDKTFEKYAEMFPLVLDAGIMKVYKTK